VWDATVLPHCVHLFSCGACQRCEALRVRRRIFEVLRFGTPIRRGVGKQSFVKRQPRLPLPPSALDSGLFSYSYSCSGSFGQEQEQEQEKKSGLQLQLIQRAPVGRAFAVSLSGWRSGRGGGAFSAAFAVAMRMGGKIKQDILTNVRGEIDQFRAC